MTNNEKYLLLGGISLAFILLTNMARAAYYTITDWLIPNFEGFRATPYWDNKQYTWGYGTRAPGPTGTITQAKALSDMRAYIDKDYSALYPLIARHLTPNQWAALLSFSFNEGRGAAVKLIPDINGGDQNALEEHWKKYIYAGGVINSDLVDRRAREWEIWQGAIN